MLRYALTFALTFSVLAAAQFTVSADDKAPDKSLEGKLVCTKCKLGETAECGNALVVKEGGKDVTYYLTDKGKAEKYHKCSGEQHAKVTGKVSVKDGKHMIANAKVEKLK